jgi:serine/threonine protein kinase
MSSESEYSESVSSDEILDHDMNLELNGMIINNYNIICELGRGSYSIVWLAFNISNNNFFALKVQNPNEYKDGLDEIKFLKELPTEPNVFNNIIDCFVHTDNDMKYLCSSYMIHCSNIDSIIRNNIYSDGLPLHIVKKIMKQLITAIYILHNKFEVFHGDIKTDNILVKGNTTKQEFIMKNYKELYLERYNTEINNINSKKVKKTIRGKLHTEITELVLDKYSKENNIVDIDSKYLEDINISLADFGTHCEIDNYYDSPFGTRYYQAPEIILMGKCSLPVDIWALGCTFYELLSGQFLFDPIKDNEGTRDYYHLKLINDTCGEFSESFLKSTRYYKNFFNNKYKLINSKDCESSRLDRKLNEIGLDNDVLIEVKELMKQMLKINPKERIKIKDLFNHNFFCI